MERVTLQEGLSFSRIVHGHWRAADWNKSTQEFLTLTEQCLELGITTFDNANIYGDYTCEGLFGKVLKAKPDIRERIEIVTKCGIKLANGKNGFSLNHYDSSKEHIIESAERSLKELNTDYIDVLLLHRPDVLLDPGEVAEAFALLKKQGKVKHFGVSNYLPSQVNMLQASLDMPLVTNQVELSVMYRDNFENGVLDQCIEKKMPPMAWSPLNQGLVFTSETEKAIRVRNALKKTAAEIGANDIDEVLYAWLMKHPAGIMPIVGSGRIERIQSAVNSLSLKLDRQQWYEIWVSSRGRDVD